MILLCGIPSEDPLSMARQRLADLGVPFLLFNQRKFESSEFAFEISPGRVHGYIRVDGRVCLLEAIRGVYLRLMDDQNLPELGGEPAGSPRRGYCRALHDALTRWCDIAPCRVVNRLGPMASNFSKPYQSQLIREHGFDVPDTLITNHPQTARGFIGRHQQVVVKSISGVRSIVRTLREEDLARLDCLRWCPVQFQEFIQGTNVRVHTVGGEVFATAAATEATDYRYASRQVGEAAALRPYELSPELAERCVALSRGLGLAFAGIDLKLTPEGRAVCFEVNPCPAYSYYEAHTGQPISLALARYLSQDL